MAGKKAREDGRELPDEVLTEILLRLQAKPLTRFNGVCKSWSYSFTTNAFLLRHSRSTSTPDMLYAFCYSFNSQQLHINPINLLFYKIPNTRKNNTTTTRITTPVRVPLPKLPINKLVPFENITITVSNFCNGLVCFVSNLDCPFLLFSVKTNDFLALPSNLSRRFDSSMRYWCCLGFEPNKSEYKVILRMVNRYTDSPQFAILTIGSSSWKQIHPPPSLALGNPQNGFCLHGIMCWIQEECSINWIASIVTFDLAREEFRVVHVVKEVVESFFNVHEFEYFHLAPLNDCPTLFVWTEKADSELIQLTLSDDMNLSRTRTIVNSYIQETFWCPMRCYKYCGDGPIAEKFMHPEPLEPLKTLEYICYDFENAEFKDIEIEEGDQVLRIGADNETPIACWVGSELLHLTLSDYPNVGRTRKISFSNLCNSKPSRVFRDRYYGGSNSIIVEEEVMGSKPLGYLCYELKNGTCTDVEIEEGNHVLRIGVDTETDIAS